jgi:hypothetical protein
VCFLIVAHEQRKISTLGVEPGNVIK